MNAQITAIKQDGTDIRIEMKVFHPAHARDGDAVEKMFEALHLGKCDITQE